MKWQKLVEREGDFLKNHLLYENFVENFPKVFNKNHPHFLTIRNGNVFVHYVDEEGARNLSFFIKEQIRTNPAFMYNVVETGKKHFRNLLKFSEGVSDFKSLDNEKLAETAREYFRLYKEPYPYFNLSVFADELEKEGQNDVIRLMAEWRLFGRTHFNKTHDLIEPLFQEVAHRLDLSIPEVKFLKPTEIIDLLLIKPKIKIRQQCYFLFKDGKFVLKENESYMVGEILINEVRGTGTFPAKYSGKIRLIKDNHDIQNVAAGEILVLRMTTPDLMLEGIRKAGAIITDEGGMTCHAAVISREFNIPALMGTKVATKLFQTGDFVEVDTELGVAKKI